MLHSTYWWWKSVNLPGWGETRVVRTDVIKMLFCFRFVGCAKSDFPFLLQRSQRDAQVSGEEERGELRQDLPSNVRWVPKRDPGCETGRFSIKLLRGRSLDRVVIKDREAPMKDDVWQIDVFELSIRRSSLCKELHILRYHLKAIAITWPFSGLGRAVGLDPGVPFVRLQPLSHGKYVWH